jgi:hypothetical protein
MQTVEPVSGERTLDIAQLRAQHDELEMIAGELTGAIMAGKIGAVAAIRWHLARALIEHLAIEDRWLYPRLIGTAPSAAADMAIRFKEEMGDLSSVFTVYMANWTADRINREWPKFRQETMNIIAALQKRIGNENNELYPIVMAQNQAIVVEGVDSLTQTKAIASAVETPPEMKAKDTP